MPVRKWLEPWPVVSSADNCDYYSITGGQRRSSSQEGVTMVSSPSLILITMSLGALARLDTLSPSDYLTLTIDCKDSRIQVSAVIKDCNVKMVFLLKVLKLKLGYIYTIYFLSFIVIVKTKYLKYSTFSKNSIFQKLNL